MDLNLKNKVFIVTGGSKGIGEGITRELVQEGARVVIGTRSQDKNSQDLLKELNSENETVHLLQGDLRDTDFCRAVVDQTAKRFNRIDGIVNNAGINDSQGLEQGPQAFRESVNNNLYHYFDLVHFALPWLKDSKGSIVNIASKVALTGQGGTSGYAASKGAQLALTREWAVELLPYAIRVNAVLPAEVMTPLYRSWLNNNFEDPQLKEQEICRKIPLEQRMTTSQEIAAAVVFLLSDRSAHTTGQLWSIDGGYVHLDRGIN